MIKRVIAFSLFGTDPVYLEGALVNAALQPQFYPGWKSRFYISEEIPDAVINQLRFLKAEIIPMPRKNFWDGTFWRFLPAGEPGIDRVIIRDVDSRFSVRETEAVDEWIATRKTFHIMRDNRYHAAPILGGMWGCCNHGVPQMTQLIDAWRFKEQKGDDQHFLGTKIYPLMKDDVLIHSEQVTFKGEKTCSFPSLLEEGKPFIGQPVNTREPQHILKKNKIIEPLPLQPRRFRAPLDFQRRLLFHRILIQFIQHCKDHINH